MQLEVQNNYIEIGRTGVIARRVNGMYYWRFGLYDGSENSCGCEHAVKSLGLSNPENTLESSLGNSKH